MRTYYIIFSYTNFKIFLRHLHYKLALQGSKALLQSRTQYRAGYTPCRFQGTVPAASRKVILVPVLLCTQVSSSSSQQPPKCLLPTTPVDAACLGGFLVPLSSLSQWSVISISILHACVLNFWCGKVQKEHFSNIFHLKNKTKFKS